MKRLILLILIISLFCVGGAKVGFSEESSSEYLRVITDDTPFFSNVTDANPLFFLPYTYYVKVISKDDAFTHVEVYGDDGFAAIDGYVPTEYLFSDNLKVLSPYLNLTVSTLQTAVMYGDYKLTEPVQYVFSDRDLRLYGFYPTEHGVLYFVGYNSRLGYVKETDLYPFTVPNHPNELTFLTPDEETPTIPTPTKNEDPFSLKTVIVLCLLFAGLVALFIALKGKPNTNAAASYYDENDYE